MKTNPLPRRRLLRTRPATRGLGGFLLFAVLLAGAARGEVGNGVSALFSVDTRYGFSFASGTSSFFTVDTRHSGWSGDAFSTLFTVDTRGATTGAAVIAGRVTDSSGAALSGATVSALVSSITRAQAATDPGGYFTLASLPAATYDLRVVQSGYLSGVRYGLAVADAQALWQNFALPAMPAPPVVVPTTRTPDPPPILATSQLKRFVSPNWVPVTSPSDIDPAKPTVVLTHGWNGSPESWPLNMAAKMVSGGINNANLLAWDWGENAYGRELVRALGNTSGEGRMLAQTLTNVLGLSYQQGIHFIGHSLGTLVNAKAADYLHSQNGGAFDWRRTQITALDNAEAANVGGQLLRVGYSAPGFERVLGSMEAPPLGWCSPLPGQRAWADNYISVFGLYHSGVVNVQMTLNALVEAAADPNPFHWMPDAHSRAWSWYAATAQNPDLCSQLGNRYSFERLGTGAQFPSPSPYPPGTLLVPSFADDFSLAQVQNPIAYNAALGAEIVRSGLLSGLSTVEGIVEGVGNVIVDVQESAVAVLEEAEEIADRVVSASISSLRAVLRSVIGGQRRVASGLALGEGAINSPDLKSYTNSPSAVWLPIQVPANAALFAFDFTFTGDPAQDLLSASLAGTNVFALEAQDMPAGQLLNSGPIDVSPFAGQTVELFFGLLGGTSTNATLAIAAMRFYQLDPPLLAAEKGEAGIILSWSAMTSGYALEASDTLASPNWAAVTNAPVLSGLRQYVTNSVAGQSQFYRLRRN